MKPAWEYRVERAGTIWQSAKPEVLERMLNELAMDGWELDKITPHGSTLLVVLRRKVAQPARSRPRRWPG